MNWFSKTFRALSPNCKEVIRLQSEALDRPLLRMQRLGLWIHRALCIWCSRYGKQIKLLRTIAQRCDHGHDPKQTMPPEARERIQRRLQAEINK